MWTSSPWQLVGFSLILCLVFRDFFFFLGPFYYTNKIWISRGLPVKISWINDKVCAGISCFISLIQISQIVRLLSKTTSFFLDLLSSVR